MNKEGNSHQTSNFANDRPGAKFQMRDGKHIQIGTEESKSLSRPRAGDYCFKIIKPPTDSQVHIGESSHFPP